MVSRHLKNIKDKYRPWLHRVKERIWRRKWFTNEKTPNTFKGMISCVDGKTWHGGMCDRFKGIISTYSYCKINGIPFRIKYDFPFNLCDYLLPNTYDWLLKDGEYSDSTYNSEILYLIGEVEETIKGRYRRPKCRQIHVYANRNYLEAIGSEDKWGTLFKELFKPGPRLTQALQELNYGKYIACVFRFQNLIGDFHEYDFQPLDKYARELLLSKCEHAVRCMIESNPGKNILVTSDSSTFLSRVKDLEQVIINPGEVIHIDSEGNDNKHDAYLKSFIDFFTIGGAEKVYGMGTEEMYHSEFPLYAAKINDVPFERIIIK